MKRNLILSPAFKEFEQSANPRTREKLRYAYPYWKRSVRYLSNLSRNWSGQISSNCGCPWTTRYGFILFAVDNDNINLVTNVILLNGFVKKSTKDYDKEITKAINILRNLL